MKAQVIIQFKDGEEIQSVIYPNYNNTFNTVSNIIKNGKGISIDTDKGSVFLTHESLRDCVIFVNKIENETK